MSQQNLNRILGIGSKFIKIPIILVYKATVYFLESHITTDFLTTKSGIFTLAPTVGPYTSAMEGTPHWADPGFCDFEAEC